jgi:hypothetical protein
MNAARTAASLMGVAMSVLSVALAGQPLLGQVLPPPGSSAPGLVELLSNPAGWLTDMFNSALVSISNKTTGDVVGFMNWLLGSGNVISQTPAALSYDNAAVTTLWGRMCFIGNAALAVVTVWGGANIIVHPHIRAPYHGALELVPRVLLCAIMINTSLYWGRFVIELNNALCQEIGFSSGLPGLDSLKPQQPDAGGVLLNLIAMAVYLVMGMLLTGQMMMRLALVDALLVLAPLALMCWVLPQTYSWARLWFTTFFGTVFVQAVQVLVLRLGADLIQRLPGVLLSVTSDTAEAGRVWLTTLFLSVAVLQLARKIPRLMPGYPGGLVAPNAGFSPVRQITSFFSSGNKKGGR